MGLEFLIIPIIVVAVWIVSTLLRGADDSKRPGRPAQRKPEKATDLDRFLREVQRRRDTAESAEPRPRREEARPAQAERRRPPQSRGKGRTSREEAIPVVLAVEEVAPSELVGGAPVMSVLTAPPLPEIPRMPADTSAASVPESPALVGLRELLQTRDGLRQAMILQEVLGPPLSRRGRR
ncbi:MAG TPA: hypothetical protein VKA46_32650 [Gemmataceae bacterium]|nr:hypothetical protein [Gemmataceae bacterium]